MIEHAFVSYSREDRAAMTALVNDLDVRGVTVLVDLTLSPGLPWQQQLEAALARVPATLVLIGPSGLSAWQRVEVDVAVARAAIDPAFRVIPTLIDGVTDETLRPHSFLARFGWLDLRLDRVAALDRLAGVLLGHSSPPAPRVSACSTTMPPACSTTMPALPTSISASEGSIAIGTMIGSAAIVRGRDDDGR